MRSLVAAAALAVLVAGCLGGDSLRPLGGYCTAYDQCEFGLVCQWETCRATCVSDSDCPEGRGCIATPSTGDGRYDYGYRVCNVEREVGCGEGGGCPPELGCAPDSVCREECHEDLPCPSGYECIGDVCMEVSASVLPAWRRPLAGRGLPALRGQAIPEAERRS